MHKELLCYDFRCEYGVAGATVIDYQTVFEKVKTLIDLSPENEERLEDLSKACAATLSRRLKEGFTGEEDEAVYACAAFAVYRYALLKSCADSDFEQLKAGDITVSRSPSSLLESTEKLLADALSSAECFTDIGFIFKGF